MGMGSKDTMPGGDCLCKGMPGVTYVAIRGATVGILGLADSFRLWRETNRDPDDLTDEEILRAISARNYVPEPAESDYAAAVRKLYAAHREPGSPPIDSSPVAS
jgi:hypothetical protein